MRSAEIGLEYGEFQDMTWKEWQFKDVGYEIRFERQLDMMRNLIASNFNSSGFVKKKVSPDQIMQLPILNELNGKTVRGKRQIKRVSQSKVQRALEIFNKLKDGD